jgi:hypothetical protein
VGGASREECARTDAQVAETALDRVVDAHDGAGLDVPADLQEVPAGNDEQLVRPELGLGHGIQLRGAHEGVAEVDLPQDRLDGCNVFCRCTGSSEEQDGRVARGIQGRAAVFATRKGGDASS